MLGKEIIHLERVDSTSNYIATLLKTKEINSGVVVLADIQDKGRGQRGTIWQSEENKNLTFSIFLKHETLSIENQTYLNQLVSIVMVELLLNKNKINAKIKWPNDILIESQKIAGILIENQIQGERIKSSIIGIGINLNQTQFSDFNATSLKLKLGKDIDKIEFLHKFIDSLNSKIHWIEQKNFNKIKADYLFNLWLKDVESNFESDGQTFKGIITGIDSYGRLEIHTDSKTKCFGLKEITFLARNR